MIDRSSPMPLYVQLKSEFIKAIVSGKWEINSKIPSEPELMKIYGVGRATVREAISLLIDQGYLRINQGIGTFVISDKPSLGFEPLMSLSYTLKAKGIMGESSVLEKHLYNPSEEEFEKFKWKNKNSCLYLKRLRTVSNAPIAIEHSYFTESFYKKNDKQSYEGSLTNIIINVLKIKINKIEQTITLGKPSKEEQELLKIDDSNEVVYLDRWIYAEGESEPFYYLKFVLPESLYLIQM